MTWLNNEHDLLHWTVTGCGPEGFIEVGKVLDPSTKWSQIISAIFLCYQQSLLFVVRSPSLAAMFLT